MSPQSVNTVDPLYLDFVEKLFKNFYRNGINGQAPPALDEPATLMHAAVGIAGEAGELLDAVKKLWVYNKPLDRDNLVEELGDLFFYFVKAMNMNEITFDEVIRKNQEKLRKRYPNAVYSDSHAQARLDKQPENSHGS